MTDFLLWNIEESLKGVRRPKFSQLYIIYMSVIVIRFGQSYKNLLLCFEIDNFLTIFFYIHTFFFLKMLSQSYNITNKYSLTSLRPNSHFMANNLKYNSHSIHKFGKARSGWSWKNNLFWSSTSILFIAGSKITRLLAPKRRAKKSLDLPPSDFCSLGYLKCKVYASNPRATHELNSNTREKIILILSRNTKVT